MNLTLLRLLDALLAAADAEGRVEVTIARLAGSLGDVGERQVQRLLRALETAGHVIPLHKRGGRGTPSRFRVGKGDIRLERVTCDVTLSPADVTLSPAWHVTLSAKKGDTPSLPEPSEKKASPREKGDIEPERSALHVTLSAQKGDMEPERVTCDVTLSSPPSLPPSLSLFSPCTPNTPNSSPPYIPPTAPAAPAAFLPFPDLRLAEVPEKPPRPRNLAVDRADAVYRGAGAEPPSPSAVMKWVKAIGEEPLIALLEELAAQGHLAAKPESYVHAVVQARQHTRPAPHRFTGKAPGVDSRRLAQAAALGRRRGGAA